MDPRNISGTIRRFPYRTAVATDIFLQLPRILLKELELNLAEQVSAGPDNHVVYAVTQPSPATDETETVYIMFSDFTVSIGRGVREGRW